MNFRLMCLGVRKRLDRIGDLGHRALAESILDWRHELATAQTPRQRVLVHWRSLLGLGRVTLFAVGAQCVATICTAWGWSLLAWVFLLPVVLHHGLSTDSVSGMEALAIYLTIQQMFAFGVFWAVATRSRQLEPPFYGLIALVLLSSIVASRGIWPLVWSVMAQEDAARWLMAFHGQAPGAEPLFWLACRTLLPLALIPLANRVRVDRRRAALLWTSVAVFALLTVGEQYIRFTTSGALANRLLSAVAHIQRHVIAGPTVALILWAALRRRQRREAEAMVSLA